jgi:YidC/Oxa1 family membrane protein insertase
MDNVRLILIISLSFILLMMYQAWQEDYGSKQPPRTASTNTTVQNSDNTTSSVPSLSSSTSEEIPTASKASPIELPVSQNKRPLASNSRIFVETDVFKLEIDTVGGDVRRVYLPNYPVTIESLDEPMILMNDELPNLFVAQSGLVSKEGAPTHLTIYSSEQSHYKLKDESLDVKLTWQNSEGIKVNKIYTFHKGSYVIGVKYIVENNSNNKWQGQLYGQFQRTEADLGGSRFLYTYMGGAISSPDELYEKISFDDMLDGSLNKENRKPWKQGWAAMLQHYFVAAWIPNPNEFYEYETAVFSGGRYALRLKGPQQIITPHQQESFNLNLYVGPKIQDKLGELASGLELTVDYGWLWFIAQPVFWMMKMIHEWLGNWGWAIIIITIMIKLAFFHLSATSYKSMANMRRLQPRLASLKERYGDDKARLNQAMMEMYKKEKINPLGGCLPIVVQIPVFIALYWVLLESVELRQAPFIFWIKDLSTQDPYYVLPVIMGVTMFLQHHLNPAPIDPIQQKVMMALPFVFTIFFAFFPAGLVLYWVVNNILSISQQWVITKKIDNTV